MNPMFKSIMVLTLISLIAAALLGITYVVTQEGIKKQVSADLQEKLKMVFPDATDFEDKTDYYIAYKGKDVMGYAAIAESSGYSSILRILVGMDLNKKITGIRVLEQAETPGLGTNIQKPDFYEQFTGLTSSEASLKKDKGTVDGITGATISSRAVAKGVVTVLRDKLEKLVSSENSQGAAAKNEDQKEKTASSINNDNNQTGEVNLATKNTSTVYSNSINDPKAK